MSNLCDTCKHKYPCQKSGYDVYKMMEGKIWCSRNSRTGHLYEAVIPVPECEWYVPIDGRGWDDYMKEIGIRWR